MLHGTHTHTPFPSQAHGHPLAPVCSSPSRWTAPWTCGTCSTSTTSPHSPWRYVSVFCVVFCFICLACPRSPHCPPSCVCICWPSPFHSVLCETSLTLSHASHSLTQNTHNTTHRCQTSLSLPSPPTKTARRWQWVQQMAPLPSCRCASCAAFLYGHLGWFVSHVVCVRMCKCLTCNSMQAPVVRVAAVLICVFIYMYCACSLFTLAAQRGPQ